MEEEGILFNYSKNINLLFKAVSDSGVTAELFHRLCSDTIMTVENTPQPLTFDLLEAILTTNPPFSAGGGGVFRTMAECVSV